jgi:hypothetical protein
MKIKIGLLLFLMLICTPSIASKQKDDLVTIHGRITDKHGNALEGTVLRFFKREQFISTNIKFVKQTITNAQGNYTLDGIPYGYYMVSIDSIGFQRSEMNRVFLSEENNLFDFSLEKFSVLDVKDIEIEGTVRQPNKTLLKDATVSIISALNAELVQRTRTDENGRYKFKVYPHDQYIIHVSKPGFVSSAATVFEKTDFILMPKGDR